MAKRTFDVLSSLLALIVLSPLLFIIGVIVRNESEGGAFFRQIRVGKNGEPFTLLKFRSMRRMVQGP
jgi:lipopolysaccharide/colanic/teichoic acid biosynthesis glycosyltransferase